MGNRILRVGLVLFLSVLLGVPIQAEEPSRDPGPGEACRAFSFPWRLPCVWLVTPRDPWAILLTTPGVLTDHLPAGRGSGCGCGVPPPTLKAGSSVGQGFPGVDEMLATDMAVAGLLPSDFDVHEFAEIPVEPLDLGGGPPAPEAAAWLLPRRGTNGWRALGSALGSDGGRGGGGGDGGEGSL